MSSGFITASVSIQRAICLWAAHRPQTPDLRYSSICLEQPAQPPRKTPSACQNTRFGLFKSVCHILKHGVYPRDPKPQPAHPDHPENHNVKITNKKMPAKIIKYPHRSGGLFNRKSNVLGLSKPRPLSLFD